MSATLTLTSPAEMLIEEVGAGILALDRQGVVVYANASARALLAPFDPAGYSLRDTLDRVGRETVGFDVVPERRTAVIGKDGRVLSVAATVRADGGWAVALDDVTAHRRAGAATHRDELTGLVSRKEIESRLSTLLTTLKRDGGEAALLCLDLDRFKPVNDTLGHSIGDTLLRMVAQRLRSVVREADVVARLGGDEFAILQVGGHQPQAADALARRLVELLGRAYITQGHMINVGASVGIALIPCDGTDAGVVMRNADLALYKAKADGRGTHRLFELEMDRQMQVRRGLEVDLRRAVALRQLELAYQPQTNLSDGRLMGFEALLRWNHPRHGVVPPGAFIPLAEEVGLIVPIGAWVLRAACAEAATWPGDLSVAVNLSAVQFRDPRLVETVSAALSVSGLPPERLELEITEGALLEDTNSVLTALNAMRAQGVRVSMDDFGTGYSSLSYLQRFPFDRIKIDQSFVRNMVGHDSAAIIRAVAGLGASLGMSTVAEGVETRDQLDRIRAEGCTAAQGYLISRPLHASAARSFIQTYVADRPA